jgi:hypothetical protein
MLSRRQLLLGSVALQLFGALPVDARGKSSGSNSGNGDHGIGGSGLSVHGGENEDHGIGGTGIVGTIQGFGSIIVNDVHIPFTRRTPVTIDGKRVSTREMQIGHVVRVLLDGPRARRISITSEVQGRIDRIGARSLSILHQRVATHGLDTGSLKVGDVVAVFGIRKPDGKIVARRIEPRPAGAGQHVRGVAEPRGAGVAIGGLSLGPRYFGIVGRPALVRFQTIAGLTAVSTVAVEPLVPGLKRGIVNVETYGRQGSSSLVLGIGRFPPRGPMRFGPGGHAFADIAVRDGGRLMDPRNGMRTDFGPSAGSGPNGQPGGPPPDGRPFDGSQFNGPGFGPGPGLGPGSGPPPGGPPPGGPPPGSVGHPPGGFGGPGAFGGPGGPPSGPPGPAPD